MAGRVAWLRGALLAAVLVAAPVRLAHAQNRTVTGTVNDVDSREPLVGAQINLKGTPTIGTQARDDGSFSLSVPAQDVVLVVRRIGYPVKEVAVP